MRIIITGEYSTGKTEIIRTYVYGVRIDKDIERFSLKTIKIDKKIIQLEYEDVPIDPESNVSFYCTSLVIIGVFDHTNKESLGDAVSCINYGMRYVNEMISSQGYKRSFNVSAKTGEGINEMFETITRDIIEKKYPTSSNSKKEKKKEECIIS